MEDGKNFAYKSRFETGSVVRIEAREVLEKFMRTWKYHHKLQPEQLEFAGHSAKVLRVSFYHGGEVLYELDGVPGIWHERCLGST